MSDRPSKTWVLAPNHRWFRQWCSDNNKDHNDPNVVAITTVENCLKRMSGMTWQDGDRAVDAAGDNLLDLERGLWEEWCRQLRRMGSPEV